MKVPKDEMMLAELIAVASAHGLRSCRGAAFKDKKGYYNVNRYNRDWNIGAAFEMALRGSDE